MEQLRALYAVGTLVFTALIHLTLPTLRPPLHQVAVVVVVAQAVLVAAVLGQNGLKLGRR